jgi:hypothetical protein
MPAPPSTTRRLQPAHFLTAFAAELLQAKRVLFLGDVSSGLAEHIATISGRRVHAMDPDAMRVSTAIAAARGRKRVVRFELLETDVPLRDTFDAVVIPDARPLCKEAFASASAMLQWATDSLTGDGLIIMQSPNAEVLGSEQGEGALAYLELYDALAEYFEHVAMLGQAPFKGCTIAMFGAAEEPSVTIDSSLMPTAEQPTHYIGIASHLPLRTESYMVLQIPSEASNPTASSQAQPKQPNELEASESAQRNKQLRKELDHAKGELQRTKQGKKQDHTERMRLVARVSELEQQLQQANALAVATRGYEQRVAELERALEQSEAESQALDADAHQEELDQMLDRIAELEQALADGKRATQDQLALAKATAKQENQAQAHATNKALMQQADGVRAEAQTRLDEEVQRHQRVVRKLEQALNRAQSESKELRGQLKTKGSQEDDVALLNRQLAAVEEQRNQAQSDAETLRSKLATKGGKDDALAQLKRKLSELEQSHRTQRSDGEADGVKRLERQLRERGKHVQGLQQELHDVERVGRELLVRLNKAVKAGVRPSPASQPEPTGPSTDALAKAIADRDEARKARKELNLQYQRQEADLAAAQWRVQALEGQLETSQSPAEQVQLQLEEALRLAQAEIAQLRRSANRRLDEESESS